jgi:hypothetical protein
MSCPIIKDSNECKSRQCSPKERQVNELKCNIPVCAGQELCIPVYYTPSDLKASVCGKVLGGNEMIWFFVL